MNLAANEIYTYMLYLVLVGFLISNISSSAVGEPLMCQTEHIILEPKNMFRLTF